MRSPGDSGPDRAQHVVGTEAELRQQGAGLATSSARWRARNASTSDRRGVEGPAHLVDLADDRRWPSQDVPERQRDPAQQRGQQRRLARAVGPGDRDPVARRDVQVDRPEPELAAFDNRVASPATSSGRGVAGTASCSRSSHGSRGSSTSSRRSSARKVRAAAAPRACAPATLAARMYLSGSADAALALVARAAPCRAQSFSWRARSTRPLRVWSYDLVGRPGGRPRPLALLGTPRSHPRTGGPRG